MFDLIITTNGPGEMATWVEPFVKEFKKHYKSSRLILLILPCRFKTGRELEVAKTISEIDIIIPANQIRKAFLKLPFILNQKKALLFLGGDLGLAGLFAKRYRLPAFAYTEGNKEFSWFYKKIFTREKDGDLMFSFFQNYQEDKNLMNKLDNTENIVFFPGSRPHHFNDLFPIFKQTIPLIDSKYRCIFNISPFITDKDLAVFDTKGLELYRNKTTELVKSATLVVTIPGTNNIQLAYLNTPALVVFPFNKPKAVDFNGLIGFILNIPGLRTWKKRMFLEHAVKKVKFTSLVNRKENKEIFPELRGYLQAENLAIEINKLLNDNNKLNAIRDACESLPKESVVLQKLIQAISDYV